MVHAWFYSYLSFTWYYDCLTQIYIHYIINAASAHIFVLKMLPKLLAVGFAADAACAAYEVSSDQSYFRNENENYYRRKNENENSWGKPYTAILCQPTVAQQCEHNLASSS